jgi:cytochrome c-type biogenesis protein CcmF
MGWLFLVFMGATLLGSLAVFAWRSGSLKSRERLDSILSRESAFLTQNVLFLSVAMVTLWGTIYPVISEATQGLTITVGRPFFDRVNGPLLLVLVFLMGVGPLLPWRRASARNVLYALWYPLGSAAIGVVLLVVIGVSQPVALMALAVIIMGIGGIVHEWVRGTRSRIRNGESYPVAFTRLLAANRPRYGGYIVHLSIAMLAVGAIGSSFYDMQRDIPMSPGDTRSLGGYSFTYLGVSERSFSDRDEGMARFAVTSGDRDLGIMSTTRTFYRDFRIAATRAAIRSTPLEDFYIVPSEFGEDGQTVFRVYVNPLVWWMWASGPLLALGTLLAVSPRRRLAPAPVTGPDGMGLARV